MAEMRAQWRCREQEEQAVSTLVAEPVPLIPGEPGDTPEQLEEAVSTPAVGMSSQGEEG